MGSRSVAATTYTAIGAAAVTLGVTLAPSIHLAYRSPSVHLVIETVGTSIALMAAMLALGRFRQTGAARDLLLVSGLVVLGGTNMIFAALPAIIGTTSAEISVWAPLTTRLVGALLVMGAAFAPAVPLRNPRRAPAVALLACALLFATVGAAAVLLDGRLPVAIDRTLPPESSGGPLLVGHPVLLGVQGITALLYGLAAIGFARGAVSGLYLWLGPAAALGAFARVNYLLFPSIYSEWVYTGDFFRLGFYGLLLAGEVQEIRLYWRRETTAAALDERRRLARDLHDGLAQELAFIVREASGSLPRAQLAAAAERALAESRRAIAALSGAPGDPIELALREAGDDVARRAGGTVDYELAAGLEVTPPLQEALIRIMREAVVNAIRHGAAERVRVRLDRADGLRLVVEDDGAGFDPAEPTSSGYGLISMRERAEAAGGTFTIRSRLGAGTTVEVALP
jgi:signal transduction histidine kinase